MKFKEVVNTINSKWHYIYMELFYENISVGVNISFYDLKINGLIAVKCAANKLYEVFNLIDNSITFNDCYNYLLNNFLRLYAERYI